MSTSKRDKNNPHMDNGRAWFVLAACAFNCSIAVGIGMNCSVYTSAMIEYYGSNRATGYTLGALSYGVAFCAGPLASVLIDRTSHRTVMMLGSCLATLGLILSATVPSIGYQYATFGVLTAVGYSFMYQSSLVVLVLYFKKYVSLATSLTTAGASTGVLIYPIMSQFLIDTYTWQPSLYIVAGICLNCCVGSLLVQPVTVHYGQSEEDIRSNESRVTKKDTNIINDSNPKLTTYKLQTTSHSDIETDIEIKKEKHDEFDVDLLTDDKSRISCDELDLLRNRNFILFLINALLTSANATTVFIVAADLYHLGNISEYNQSILLMTFGVSNILGRLLCTLWLRYMSRTTCYCFAITIAGFAVLLYMLNTDMTALVIANVIFGLSFGGEGTTLYLVGLDIAGVHNVNRAYGYTNFVNGLGGLIAPPLYGAIYDATQNYLWAMVMAAIFNFVAVALMIPTTQLWKKIRCM